MSSQHNALVESLECYMEEVVESFEDFVKKSLLLFSVGVCTVVVMLVYVLKLLTERGSLYKSGKMSSVWPMDSQNMYPILSTHEKVTMQHLKPKVTCTSANTLVMKSIWPRYEEQVLRNIGFSNCHKCMQIGESFHRLHTSFDNLHTQITLSSDRNRQRSITITPVRRRRDLSLPSRIPDNLPAPPLERIWNYPKVPATPIPIFDNRDESKPDTVDEIQRNIKDEIQVTTRKKSNIEMHQRHESKLPYKKLTAAAIPPVTRAKDPAAKLSWTILTRDAVAYHTHIHRMRCRVSDGKLPLPVTTSGLRQVTSPAQRHPSPTTKSMIPSCTKPSPQKKIPQKNSSFTRHGDYLRSKK